jgi:peptidoglycan/xylan/chitin deacetylase (PgdA/CDA1 family)
MNRRRFAVNLGMSAVALGASRIYSFSSRRKRPPQVAITLDDFAVYDTPTLSGAARNRAILDALRQHKLRAGMFVAGKFVDNQTNLPLLRLWDEHGHIIANHTYSHWEYPKVEFQKFTQDILRDETLLEQFSRYRKFFRFPYLNEGETAEQRDKMRAFLRERGYRNGHVTIDASDWYVDGRLRERLERDPEADVAPYREFYLDHIWDRAVYYDGLSHKVLGRSVKHTLLLHHNVLNGLFLGDILRMFRSKGWKLIDAEEAYNDQVFSATPKVIPAGQSIVWALAKETGRFDKILRYPAEDGSYEKPRMDALGL